MYRIIIGVDTGVNSVNSVNSVNNVKEKFIVFDNKLVKHINSTKD